MNPGDPSNSCQGVVLLVDDDRISRRTLQAFLERAGYRVLEATGVDEAIALAGAAGLGNVECVVTDYRMPDKDGLYMLGWVHRTDPQLAAIIVTAEGEKHLVTESLRQGACDFLEKPIERRMLVEAVARGVSQTRTNRSRERAQSEVRSVAAAQQEMIGISIPDCALKVDLRYHPSHEAGGDHLAVFELGGQRYLVLTTDVSGHDLRAAYLSVFFQGFARGMMEVEISIEDILARFNRYLVTEANGISTGNQVTSVAVGAILLDLPERNARTLCCGFPVPHLADGAGVTHPVGGVSSSPLGWFEDAVSEPVDFKMCERSRLYIWTDGLEDLATQLGVSPLACAFALLRGPTGEPAPEWMRRAQDDILLASISSRPIAQAVGEFFPIISSLHPGTDFDSIDAIQKFWRESIVCALPELEDDKLHDVLLCCREILLNALNHGCQRSPDLKATLNLSCDLSAKVIRVIIEDPGPGHNFDWRRHKRQADVSLIDEHRGLILIDRIASRFEMKGRGAHVEMDFIFNGTPRAMAS